MKQHLDFVRNCQSIGKKVLFLRDENARGRAKNGLETGNCQHWSQGSHVSRDGVRRPCPLKDSDRLDKDLNVAQGGTQG